MDALRDNNDLCDILYRNVQKGEYSLDTIPMALIRVIDGDCWRKRKIDKLGQVIEFERFEDFVSTKPLEGLGCSIQALRSLCRENTKALDALDKATQQKQSGGKNQYTDCLSDNIKEAYAPNGTSRDAGLRRLRKDNPDLHQQVLNGDLSVHSACVKAGFRSPTITIPIDPERAAKAILKRFNADEVRHLIDLLQAVG